VFSCVLILVELSISLKVQIFAQCIIGSFGSFCSFGSLCDFCSEHKLQQNPVVVISSQRFCLPFVCNLQRYATHKAIINLLWQTLRQMPLGGPPSRRV